MSGQRKVRLHVEHRHGGRTLRTAVFLALLVQVASTDVFVHAGQFHIAFSSDSKTLATGGGDRIRNRFEESKVALWDMPTMRVRQTIFVPGVVGDLAFSPNGNLLGVSFDRARDGTAVGQVMLVDAATGQSRFLLDDGEHAGHLSFSPTENVLAVYTRKDREFAVDLWELERRSMVRALDTESVQCMVLTATGTIFISLGATVELRDTRNGNKIMSATSDEFLTTSSAYSRGGKSIAQGMIRLKVAGRLLMPSDSVTGQVRLLDATTGQLRHTIEIAHGGVVALAFSADGSMLAVGTIPEFNIDAAKLDSELRVFDTRTRGVQKDLGRHRPGLTSIAFSPDGRFLAGADSSGKIKLWETESWKSVPLQGANE